MSISIFYFHSHNIKSKFSHFYPLQFAIPVFQGKSGQHLLVFHRFPRRSVILFIVGELNSFIHSKHIEIKLKGNSSPIQYRKEI